MYIMPPVILSSYLRARLRGRAPRSHAAWYNVNSQSVIHPSHSRPWHIYELSLQSYISLISFVQSVASFMLTVKSRPINVAARMLCCGFNFWNISAPFHQILSTGDGKQSRHLFSCYCLYQEIHFLRLYWSYPQLHLIISGGRLKKNILPQTESSLKILTFFSRALSTIVLQAKQLSHFSLPSLLSLLLLTCDSSFKHINKRWQAKKKKKKKCISHILCVWQSAFYCFPLILSWEHFLPSTPIQMQIFLKGCRFASVTWEWVGLVYPAVTLLGPATLFLRAFTFRHAALWAMINLWELSR